ncbi:DNA topoisomerase I (plasmid) [Mucilaginibacter robiniae]|uniref:DNA topoisomerase I n=1 Tax=Mucilaginibacter robiniae TaxID=2728022 RepID=A0A7L5E6D6_9SPHI|nr:topoisomerase C-terminal repeat-containing protein [Mucilaginibacter robiniae]QJD98541.1 DNA topoisomerase I [Mucilaginibacter robiniae]
MEKVAKCPVCKQGDLIEGASSYMCNHFKSVDDKCSFTIYKSYFGKDITKEIVIQLATDKETDFFNDLVNRDNKPFSAKLVIQEGLIKPVFENKELQTSCPKCGKRVHVSSKAFICEGYIQNKACDLYIGRNVAGVMLSENDAEVLLNGSSTDFRTDFISQQNKEFGAKIILDEDFKTKFVFEVAKCPKCKTGSILGNAKAFSCSNFKDQQIKCDFVIWRQISGKEISANDVIALCENGSTGVIKSFKKKGSGDTFSGKLSLSQDYKVSVV